jgi:hypothetical protein
MISRLQPHRSLLAKRRAVTILEMLMTLFAVTMACIAVTAVMWNHSPTPGRLVFPEKIERSATNESRLSIPLTIRNEGGSPVRIIGFNASCTCSNVKGPPMTIPAHQSVDAIVHIKLDNPIDGKVQTYIQFIDEFGTTSESTHVVVNLNAPAAMPIARD